MRILDTINGNIGTDSTSVPIWFMRQAGRYLPEYKALRATTSDFISYCLDSDKAAEATLQPIRRYDLDAAIVFSDILLIPWAMGYDLRFEEGKGPILTPPKNPAEIPSISAHAIKTRLAPIGKTIKKTRAQLAKDKALIGFCGAPWTVSTYIIEGGSSRDFTKIKKCLWQDRQNFNTLINALITHSIEFLVMQAQCGADILMIFDSWAGIVPGAHQKSLHFRDHRPHHRRRTRAKHHRPHHSLPQRLLWQFHRLRPNHQMRCFSHRPQYLPPMARCPAPQKYPRPRQFGSHGSRNRRQNYARMRRKYLQCVQNPPAYFQSRTRHGTTHPPRKCGRTRQFPPRPRINTRINPPRINPRKSTKGRESPKGEK